MKVAVNWLVLHPYGSTQPLAAKGCVAGSIRLRAENFGARWWAGRNPAVSVHRNPLRVNSGSVGLEVKELLLLLGVQPPINSILFWRLMKAAVIVMKV